MAGLDRAQLRRLRAALAENRRAAETLTARGGAWTVRAMNVTAHVLRLALAATTCGCSAAEVATATRCPSEPVMGALHASAFHFQSGAMALGRASLREARGLLGGQRPDPTTRAIIDGLATVAALSEEAADQRARDTEQLRLQLGDWSCLPPVLHEALHRELPPVPGRSSVP